MEDRKNYATIYHAPVLVHEIVAQLLWNSTGTYVDGTLGGGGHSEAFLTHLRTEAQVFGIDQDPDAIAEAQKRLQTFENFQVLKGNFGDLAKLLDGRKVDGLLLDLGVSSYQLDEPERGFSYRFDAPLDMRMNPEIGDTAADLLNHLEEYELRLLFFKYGEEPKSAKYARSIVQSRPLYSTGDLVAALEKVGVGLEPKKVFSRIFQALRIAVNQEMDVLASALLQSLDVLKPNGRIAVISYHSLEDRMVKRFLRSGNLEGKLEKDFFGNSLSPWHLLQSKAITPSLVEIERNPRARSAKLRIAERKPSIS